MNKPIHEKKEINKAVSSNFLIMRNVLFWISGDTI